MAGLFDDIVSMPATGSPSRASASLFGDIIDAPVENEGAQQASLDAANESLSQNPGKRLFATADQGSEQDVTGIATPSSKADAARTRAEYVDKPAQSIRAGLGQAASLAAFPVASMADAVQGGDYNKEALANGIDDFTKQKREAAPDGSVGFAGKMVRTLEELAPLVATGPAAVPLIAGEATASKGIDLADQGVTGPTNSFLSALSGAVAYGFTKLPFTGSSMTSSVVRGATMNPVLGGLHRLAEKQVLEANDYDTIADSIKVLDPEAAPQEVAMGMLFGYLGGKGKPAYGATAAENFVPFWDTVKQSNWYRMKTVTERGLVAQDVKTVYDSLLANGHGEADIAKMGTAFFQEALKRRSTTEAASGEPAPGKAVPAATPAPAAAEAVTVPHTGIDDPSMSVDDAILAANEEVQGAAAGVPAASGPFDYMARVTDGQRTGFITKTMGDKSAVLWEDTGMQSAVPTAGLQHAPQDDEAPSAAAQPVEQVIAKETADPASIGGDIAQGRQEAAELQKKAGAVATAPDARQIDPNGASPSLVTKVDTPAVQALLPGQPGVSSVSVPKDAGKYWYRDAGNKADELSNTADRSGKHVDHAAAEAAHSELATALQGQPYEQYHAEMAEHHKTRASMEPATTPKAETTPATKIETSLSPVQQEFIRGKVKTLGSIEAVQAKYGDQVAPVDRYARDFADQHFGVALKAVDQAPVKPAPTGAATLAVRQDNARKSFSETLQSIAKITPEQAEKVTDAYLKNKLAKMDTAASKISVNHGVFLDPKYIKTAIGNIEAAEKPARSAKAPQPSTARAESAAEVTTASRKIDRQKDDIAVAISKLGGIDIKEAQREWGDVVKDSRKDLANHVLKQTRRFGAVFKGGGLSMDKMRESLVGHGYLPEGADLHDLYGAVESATQGKAGVSTENRQESDIEREAREHEENVIAGMSEEAKAAANDILDIVEADGTIEQPISQADTSFDFGYNLEGYDETRNEEESQANSELAATGSEGEGDSARQAGTEPAADRTDDAGGWSQDRAVTGDTARPTIGGVQKQGGRRTSTSDLMDGFMPEPPTLFEPTEKYNEGTDDSPYTVTGVSTVGYGNSNSRISDGVREQFALFTPAGDPTPEARQVAKVAREVKTFTKTARVITGHVRTGLTSVTSPQDLAHVMAGIRKKTVENFVIVVTDAQDKIVGIIDQTTGTTNQSLVHPALILGASHLIDDAENIYLVHNHPTGDPTLSPEDRSITERIHSAGRDTGLTVKGIMAVGSKTATFFAPEWQDTTGPFDIPAAARNQIVPVEGARAFTRRPAADATRITSPDMIPDAMKDAGIKGDGVILLDGKNRIVGFVPMDAKELGKLRTGDKATGAGLLTKTVREANAVAMVAISADSDSARNLGSFGDNLGVKLLDIYNPETGYSATSRGHKTQNGENWFSIGKQKPDEKTGLPLNDDGTVTVYHHTNKVRAEQIRKTGVLRAQAEPDVYVTTRKEADTGYGDTAVPIKVDPSLLQIDDEFPSGRTDYRLNVGNPGGSMKVVIDDDQKFSLAKPQTGATLTPEATVRVQSLISRALPEGKADFQIVPSIDAGAVPGADEAFAAHGVETGKVHGLHQSERNITTGEARSIITLVMDGATERTGYHEVMHAAESLGLISARDAVILAREYPDREGVKSGERRADAFAEYVESGTKPKGYARVLFARIKAFLARLKQMLTGKGWRTASDVFRDLESGKMKGRAEATGETSYPQFALARNTGEPKPKGFIKEDVLPAMETAGRTLTGSWDSIKRTFTAASRGFQAEQTALDLRELGSIKARNLDQVAALIDPARKYFDRFGGDMTDTDSRSFQFIKAVELGNFIGLPEAEKPFARLNYVIFDNLLKRIQERNGLRSSTTSSDKLAAQDEGRDFETFYFPRLWKDEKKGMEVYMQLASKRPFEGRKAFMKKRTIELYEDGINAGLIPAYDNPMDMIYHKAGEMEQWIMAKDYLAAEQKAGRVIEVPAGHKAPEGMTQLDDRMGTIYAGNSVPVWKMLRELAKSAKKDLFFEDFGKKVFPSALEIAAGADDTMKQEANALRWDTAKDQINIHGMHRGTGRSYSDLIVEKMLENPEKFQQEAPALYAELERIAADRPKIQEIMDTPTFENLQQRLPVGGQIIKAHLYAPEQSANVFNNLVSKGLRGNDAFRAYMGAANVLNQFQLGLSLFHAGFTSMDAAVSSSALGVMQASHGDIYKAIKSFAESPIAPVTNAIRGHQMMKEWDMPGSVNDVIANLVQAAQAGGARAKMDKFYHTEISKKMMQAFRGGNIFGGVVRAPFALMEKASKPILEWLVPRQKMGIIAAALKYEMERSPNMTHEELQKVSAEIVDSVDNRMGQLIYDNLFWNKITKDLAMASVRSVGWNLGTIRELGGGLLDAVEEGAKLATGKQARVTPRMAYVIALPLMVGVMGALIQYLATGIIPGDPDETIPGDIGTTLEDIYNPRIGGIDRNGKPRRVLLPSYMKDVYHYYKAPFTTIANKLHPMLAIIGEMLRNKNFYGVEVRHPDDPVVKQAMQLAEHVGKSFEPFASRGIRKNMQEGASPLETVLPFIGITPAPSDINKTKAEKLAEEMIRERIPQGARTQEQYEKSQQKKEVTRLLKTGQRDEANAKISELRAQGVLNQRDIYDIRDKAKHPYLYNLVKHMDDEGANRVFEAATPEEQDQIRALVKYKDAGFRKNNPVKYRLKQESSQEAEQ